VLCREETTEYLPVTSGKDSRVLVRMRRIDFGLAVPAKTSFSSLSKIS